MESLGAKIWSANRQLLGGFGLFFSFPVLAKFSRYKGWEVFLSRIWTFISSYWPRFFIRYFCAVLAPRLCSKSGFSLCGFIWKVLANLGKSWKICIEKRCYIKILEKIRTVLKSRRLKIKRTKHLGKKSWSSLYQWTISLPPKEEKEDAKRKMAEGRVNVKPTFI